MCDDIKKSIRLDHCYALEIFEEIVDAAVQESAPDVAPESGASPAPVFSVVWIWPIITWLAVSSHQPETSTPESSRSGPSSALRTIFPSLTVVLSSWLLASPL